MSLDGAVLHQIKNEINNVAIGARVDRIAQPSRDEIIVGLRWHGGGSKLLISAAANNARLHFTKFPPENPLKPPIFCMLLRKHLQSAKLIGIRQQGMERALYLDFETYNELGDLTKLTLVVEIMGRHSNIILINAENKIMDALHKVDFNTSSVRQVLPGLPYYNPPTQDKLNLLDTGLKEILSVISDKGDVPLFDGILKTLQGFSPLPTREIAYEITGGNPVISDLTPEQWGQLEQKLIDIKNLLESGTGTPTMVLDKTGKPKDFSFMSIAQYGGEMDIQQFDDYASMLDTFYIKRDTAERIRQKSGNLLRTVDNTSQRIARRLSAQQEELEECKNREVLKVKGDLLTANIYLLEKGQSSATVPNYYDPDGGEMTIPLDIRKSPSQNAQHYYGQYRKADTAEKKLTVLIDEGRQEQLYIDSVLDSLKRAETEADLENIRAELVDTRYLKKVGKKKDIKPVKQKPHTFLSTDGFTILAGRNNIQNDRLTLKESKGQDMWFHTQSIPGSHVIVVTEGRDVPESTLLEAAIIAAYYSKGQNSNKVAVDYAPVKHVKKIHGAKPGMVTYDNFKTILADPLEKVIDQLSRKI